MNQATLTPLAKRGRQPAAPASPAAGIEPEEDDEVDAIDPEELEPEIDPDPDPELDETDPDELDPDELDDEGLDPELDPEELDATPDDDGGGPWDCEPNCEPPSAALELRKGVDCMLEVGPPSIGPVAMPPDPSPAEQPASKSVTATALKSVRVGISEVLPGAVARPDRIGTALVARAGRHG